MMMKKINVVRSSKELKTVWNTRSFTINASTTKFYLTVVFRNIVLSVFVTIVL